VKPGDMVMIRRLGVEDELWADGEVGLVLELTKRLYIPAANILVLGEVAQFDLDELEAANETR
jgi:hypothetical protein